MTWREHVRGCAAVVFGLVYGAALVGCCDPPGMHDDGAPMVLDAATLDAPAELDAGAAGGDAAAAGDAAAGASNVDAAAVCGTLGAACCAGDVCYAPYACVTTDAGAALCWAGGPPP